MKCSICGHSVAWCVDKDDKGTYWLCGECAAAQVMETFLEEQILLRVARAAKPVLWTNNDEKLRESSFHKRLREALAAVEDLL